MLGGSRGNEALKAKVRKERVKPGETNKHIAHYYSHEEFTAAYGEKGNKKLRDVLCNKDPKNFRKVDKKSNTYTKEDKSGKHRIIDNIFITAYKTGKMPDKPHQSKGKQKDEKNFLTQKDYQERFASKVKYLKETGAFKHKKIYQYMSKVAKNVFNVKNFNKVLPYIKDQKSFKDICKNYGDKRRPWNRTYGLNQDKTKDKRCTAKQIKATILTKKGTPDMRYKVNKQRYTSKPSPSPPPPQVQEKNETYSGYSASNNMGTSYGGGKSYSYSTSNSTGTYSSGGCANGRATFTGSRGGTYTYTSGGNKSYH